VSHGAAVHQVTPSMLMFKMPVDCDAAGTVTVARGTTVGSPGVICDPKGCLDQPAGSPCEDGNACTVDDTCDGEGACVGGGPLVCDGPCLACDPASGCVPKPSTASCDDQSACTVGDHCSGQANTCVSRGTLDCAAPCLTGACDPALGCEPKPAGSTCREPVGPCDVAESCTGSSSDCPPDQFAPVTTSCDDGSACTVGDHCSGASDVCAGAPASCDDPCLTGVCDPGAGCVPRDGASALTCRIRECRKARFKRETRHLALLIDHAIERGKLPKARRVQRLKSLLERCGLARL
jgi:hypothetical protein